MPKYLDISIRRQSQLYRFITPDQWDRSSGLIDVSAYRDNHPSLSLYVGEACTPLQLLKQFCCYSHFKKLGATPESLWAEGYRIGVIPASVIFDLKLEFVRDDRGKVLIKKNGHLDVVAGQDFAIELANAARALDRARVFPDR